MRNGRLLEEASPQLLLDYYKFSSLESLFLKLCLDDGNTENKQSQVIYTVKSRENKQIFRCTHAHAHARAHAHSHSQVQAHMAFQQIKM